MSISVKIIQRTDKINQDQTAPIHLRFTHKRRCRYIATGVTLPINVWNAETQRINLNYPNAGELQFKIDSVRKEYEKKIQRLKILDIEVTFNTLLDAKSKQINCTIADYFQQQIERMENIGKIGTAAKYRYCLKLLAQCNSVNIRFEQIDMAYLRDFEIFLLNKGNVGNSIATKFSVLKAVYNKAIAEKIFIPKENPFLCFKVGRLWTATRKRAISKEDILRIANVSVSETDSPSTALAKDVFMFSYLMAGINFKDIALLQYRNIYNGRIYYKRNKTGKEMNCPLIPQAQIIINKYSQKKHTDDDYIFPILDKRIHISEQQIFNRVHKVLGHVNRELRLIGERIGLGITLTTYVARHSFASILKRSGVNIAIISESLGHSDLATTQIYLDSFENSQIDEAMKHLL